MQHSSLLKDNNILEILSYCGFYSNHRIAVLVKDALNNPVVDAVVVLKRDETDIWSAKTDNKRKAELWADLYQKSDEIDSS